MQVSGGVISQVLASNSNLKDLNIRGCARLALHPFHSSRFQKTFEWENVEAGWGISDSTFSLFGFSSCKLQNLAIGVGGTISGHTLLCISEKCRELKRLSLSFQVGTHPPFPWPCDLFYYIEMMIFLRKIVVLITSESFCFGPLYCAREI